MFHKQHLAAICSTHLHHAAMTCPVRSTNTLPVANGSVQYRKLHQYSCIGSEGHGRLAALPWWSELSWEHTQGPSQSPHPQHALPPCHWAADEPCCQQTASSSFALTAHSQRDACNKENAPVRPCNVALHWKHNTASSEQPTSVVLSLPCNPSLTALSDHVGDSTRMLGALSMSEIKCLIPRRYNVARQQLNDLSIPVKTQWVQCQL